MELTHEQPRRPIDFMGRMLRSLSIDGPLMLLLLLICAMGLFVLYSADGHSTARVNRQVVRIVVAFLGAIVIAKMPPNFLRLWSPVLYGIGIVLLLAVKFAGDMGGGARRWLDLGLFSFQPSELMKLAVPMVIAWLRYFRGVFLRY